MTDPLKVGMVIGFKVTSVESSLSTTVVAKETSEFFIRISRSRSSSLQLYCYIDTNSF